jgi:hypothetical protein
MEATADVFGPLDGHSVWILELTWWAGASEGATHWRGEISGGKPCQCSDVNCPSIPVSQWDDARMQKWLARQVDQFPLRDPASFLRGCTRNKGGPTPGDFLNEPTLVSQAVQLFADYAPPGSRLYLAEVSESHLLAELDEHGQCSMRMTGIVGLREESTVRQLTRPYPNRRWKGDGD